MTRSTDIPADLPSRLSAATRTVRQTDQLLSAIRAELDGRSWSADTCQQIAELMITAGYLIRDPFKATGSLTRQQAD